MNHTLDHLHLLMHIQYGSSTVIYKIQEYRAKWTVSKKLLLPQMPRTLLFVQAGNEVHVGAKTERTDIARIFIVFALRPLFHSLSISHTGSKERQWRHPAGPHLILAGELGANPVRWLSQSTDKQGKNLVMHQCLTMSQVTGMASGRKLQYSPFTQVQNIPKQILYNVMLHTATVD